MNTCRAAYIELRRISSIRHFLSVDATKTLMCSLVLLKLDYCNSLLSGSPQYRIQLFRKFKIQLLGLLSEPQELNIPHLSFIPFTGYLYKENQAQGLLYLLYYTDWRKSEVHVRTCQCVHSMPMPALIIR